jgi:hypothetical protein
MVATNATKARFSVEGEKQKHRADGDDIKCFLYGIEDDGRINDIKISPESKTAVETLQVLRKANLDLDL